MGKINLLDVEVSNKIAAGEVVERPASVVKELVENSIDAGAKRISVEIKNGGNTYIKITDDGSGMEREDAVVAFLRHATSKIKSEADLDAIYTLGFRGEALSSIGAVSKVDLYTKRAEDMIGTHTVCEGGEIISDDDAGVPNGTSFVVQNLFYNVPARMKFLKKDTTEAGYITDIMTRFILAHPEISFKLISNGKEVLYSSGDGKIINCIYSVYGKDYATAMLEVNYNTEFVKVTGMTGKGSAARPNRNYQSYFVNSRYIKSPMITRAVEEAYKNQIMTGKFPVAVLNIEINPSLIDINVHPTKLEVKFSNESEVYKAVYHAVEDALYRITDIPEIVKKPVVEKREERTSNFVRDTVLPNAQAEIKIPLEPKREPIPTKVVVKQPKFFENAVYEKTIEGPKEPVKIVVPELVREIKAQEKPIIETEVKAEGKPTIQETTPVTEEKNIEFKLVGQVFDTYIIIERDNEMLMIDQHAAHERLNYEKLKQEAERKKVYSQGLAIGVVAQLSANELAVFSENEEFIKSLGFEAEPYGNNSVIIRSVPVAAANEDICDLFVEIITQLGENKKEIISHKRERLLYTIACKAAIKANWKISEAEQRELVKKVLMLDGINTCPHGRPIMISMSKEEIEKNFKRIV
ncbi:MAG: DNA mismatch repair endonuclease MutL [Clostridia bacterium]|nr:DNA mismatch repair endonuclease MutL [Clostridia bacterium]